MDKLYALLVGIDAYPPPLRALAGCCNDVAAMRELLTGRIPGERLCLNVLLDEAATRQGMIDAFRKHLGQAGPDDTALFFYAGHGGQELTPALYSDLEPDGLNETLVAYDSRLPDGSGWDLADKELRVLIAEVAERGAHVVIILDSCHSGTATRDSEDAVTRQAPCRHRKRPADTFWFAAATDVKLAKEAGEAGGWKVLPSGPHVLFSACQAHETAKEYDDPNGESRGAFSYFLIRTLEHLGGDARYRDVHKRVQALVCNAKDNQLPQAEGNLEAILFDGRMPARPPVFHVQSWRGRGWRLDAGEIHAIQKGTELAVYREEALATGDGERLATVTVSETGPAESLVEVKQGSLPDEPGALPALVTKLPFPPLSVGLHPDADSAELRRRISASPYLELRELSEASVVVEPGPLGLRLRRADSLRELAPPYSAGPDGARKVSEALMKIARWGAIAGLSNPTDSIAGALRMTFFEWHSPEAQGGEPRVTRLPEGKEMCVSYRGGKVGRFTVHIENHSSQDLHFALLALDESFGIKLIRDGWGHLSAGRNLWIRKGDGIPAAVPDRFYKQGVTQRRDVLLLLVSEQNPDFQLLEQNGLFTYEEAERGPASPGFMELLDWCPACRDADVEEDGEVAPPRWSVQGQVIVSERPAS